MGSAQPVAGVVGRIAVILYVEPCEDRDFQSFAMPSPARQRCSHGLTADDLSAAGPVTVEPAVQEHLEDQPVPIKPLMRPEKSSMRKTAIAPDVSTAEEQKMRRSVTLAGSGSHGGTDLATRERQGRSDIRDNPKRMKAPPRRSWRFYYRLQPTVTISAQR